MKWSRIYIYSSGAELSCFIIVVGVYLFVYFGYCCFLILYSKGKIELHRDVSFQHQQGEVNTTEKQKQRSNSRLFSFFGFVLLGIVDLYNLPFAFSLVSHILELKLYASMPSCIILHICIYINTYIHICIMSICVYILCSSCNYRLHLELIFSPSVL